MKFRVLPFQKDSFFTKKAFCFIFRIKILDKYIFFLTLLFFYWIMFLVSFPMKELVILGVVFVVKSVSFLFRCQQEKCSSLYCNVVCFRKISIKKAISGIASIGAGWGIETSLSFLSTSFVVSSILFLLIIVLLYFHCIYLSLKK